MGAIQFGPEDNQDESVVVLLVKFALALAAIAMVNYFVFRYAVEPTQRNVAIAAGVNVAYCVVSYFVRPIPDESDMGLYGTVLNDPFSHSDDVTEIYSCYSWFSFRGGT